MICRCGYQNEPDDLYCAQCGRRLPQGKKGRKGWLIAIVVILLLAAGAVAALFLIPRGESADKPEEPQEQTQSEDEVQDPEAVNPEDVKEPGEQMPPENGWDRERVRYYADGEAARGLQEIEGRYYYFDLETGDKQTGWVEIEQAWHFFSKEGPALPAGWYSDDKGWFYLEEDGKHHTHSPFVNEQTKQEYILDEDGYLVRMEYYELVCIETREEVDGRERPVLMVPGTLTNCKELTFHQKEISSLTPVEGTIWEIWLRIGDAWTKVSESPVSVDDNSYTLTFNQPQTFDAICIFTSQDMRISSTLTSVTVYY